MAFTAGTSLIVNGLYVKETLSKLTTSDLGGAMTSSQLKQTLQVLGYLGTDPSSVAATGVTPSGASFIRMVPDIATNPAYKDGEGSSIIFPDDVQLNRSFIDNTPGNAIPIPQGFSTGYMYVNPDPDDDEVFGNGPLFNIGTGTSGGASVDMDIDEIGHYVGLTLGSDETDFAGVGHDTGPIPCHPQHNPRSVGKIKLLDLEFGNADPDEDARIRLSLVEPTAFPGGVSSDIWDDIAVPFVGAYYDAVLQNGNWQAVFSDGSTTTYVDTGVVPTNGNFVVEVEFNGGGSQADLAARVTLRDSSGTDVFSVVRGTADSGVILPDVDQALGPRFDLHAGDTDGGEMRVYWASLELRS